MAAINSAHNPVTATGTYELSGAVTFLFLDVVDLAALGYVPTVLWGQQAQGPYGGFTSNYGVVINSFSLPGGLT